MFHEQMLTFDGGDVGEGVGVGVLMAGQGS